VDSQVFLINFTVRNNGADACDKSKLFITCDGAKIAEVNVGALEGNGGLFRGSYTIAAGALPIGAHRIRLVADGANTVTESNENNNGYTRTITISQAQDSDLTIAAFTAPATVAVNQAFTLNYTVRNSGTAAVGSTKLYIYCDGVQIGETSVGAIEANSTLKGVYTINGGVLKSGSRRIRIVADGYGIVPETNEDNNGYTKTVNVTAAPAADAPVALPMLNIDMPLAFDAVLDDAVDTFEFELSASGKVDIDLSFEDASNAQVALFDAAGNEFALNEALTSVDTLSAGLYQVAVIGNDDEVKSKYAIELALA